MVNHPTTRQAHVVLGVIVILAMALRLTGIRWGLPSDAWPHIPFHPDEKWLIDTLQYLDLFAGKLTNGGYREGSLLYYIWHIVLVGLDRLGICSMHYQHYDSGAACILLTGRSVNVIFDILSLLVTYKIVLKLTDDRRAALFASMLMAIMPYLVIHSIFMRPHVPANFFLLLALYASLFIFDAPKIKLFALIGVLVGVAAAARYPFVFVGCIPILFLCLVQYDEHTKGAAPSIKAYFRGIFLDSRPYVMGCLTLVTFLLLNPGIFFDRSNFLALYAEQASFLNKDQFAGAAVFDLRLPWQHLTYLIPYGMLPGLWIVMYAGIIFALFQRRYWAYTLPMVIVFGLYFIFITKAYPFGFIRNMLFLFPIMAIFCGLAAAEFRRRFPTRPWASMSVAAIVVMLCALSGLYTAAYVSAMNRSDPRAQLHEFLDKIPAVSVTVCYRNGPFAYFTTEPALTSLEKRGIGLDRVTDLKNIPAHCSYLIVTAFEYPDKMSTSELVSTANQSTDFRLVYIFSNSIRTLGLIFDYPRPPHDLSYPFPTIYVLRNVGKASN